MTSDRSMAGTSGMFKAIVESARKFKRAVTGGEGGPEDELPAPARELGEQIARAFIARKFDDLYALGAPLFHERMPVPQFAERWSEAIEARGTLVSFAIADAGEIDLGYIPGLEDVPQQDFVAFLEIAFSTPSTALDDDGAFVVGAVLIEHEGRPRLAALHAR